MPSDKGYDHDHLHHWLRGCGIRHRIVPKSVESSQQLGTTGLDCDECPFASTWEGAGASDDNFSVLDRP
ncbi:hypothetical protein [Streptomyces sp. NBC_01445]|uniref:hypothetical protein n=1 Tax=Streptomyces sp. NBC_01445 TaxID=2903869 RepID=UPI002DD9FEBB|nr:hypothetical protein [Streptomyces sp. NBC_01445]WSE09923.1 hypothetical protein OG574_45235 [Streptomyces sp. NBC_01445]